MLLYYSLTLTSGVSTARLRCRADSTGTCLVRLPELCSDRPPFDTASTQRTVLDTMHSLRHNAVLDTMYSLRHSAQS